MFFQILISLILGLSSPSNGTVTTLDNPAPTTPPTTVGGDQGQTPPPKG